VNFNSIVLDQQNRFTERHSLERIDELSTEQVEAEPQLITRAQKHIQEYKDQLTMIQQRQYVSRQSPNESFTKINLSRNSKETNSLSKTPVHEGNQSLTPSQQNQRTIQYLSQFSSLPSSKSSNRPPNPVK
jgi:hypothetical protein